METLGPVKDNSKKFDMCQRALYLEHNILYVSLLSLRWLIIQHANNPLC